MSNELIQAVALFSGGLDSILATRLVMEQGIRVRCLHFCTPFFGKPKAINFWRKVYGLDVEVINVGDDYINMLAQYPAHGFGSAMNPCVDCKILMMRHALQRMRELGASFIISGEVIGQRPMSQRRDALNIISRDADVRGILLRPLCAKEMEITIPEQNGIVDREKLEAFSGRNRKGQMELASRLGITEIPTPAGGCKLTEQENARRYWTVLTRIQNPCALDFDLANAGRQGWSNFWWLTVGRNEADNATLLALAQPNDVLLKVLDFPGPMALARPIKAIDNTDIAQFELLQAASYVAFCSPKAVKSGMEVSVRIIKDGHSQVVTVQPKQTDIFVLPTFDALKDEIHRKI